MLHKIIQTEFLTSTFLIRMMVGVVFLSEGIQKLIFPSLRGAGRFEKIGLPSPEFLGTFIGSLEIFCGVLILIGFLTRIASSLTFMIMMVAIFTTKLAIFHQDGFWEMMHASRTDWAMLMGSLFLMIKGSGIISVDEVILKRENEKGR